MRLEVHPEAIAEAREARHWYHQRSLDAADAFMDELDWTMANILEAPMRWPSRSGVRRRLLRRFPFQVIYRVQEDVIEVLAIAHGRRRPGYWKSRLSSEP